MKQQHTLEELVPLITEWANERGLINESFVEKQKLKLFEEVGETAKAILDGDEKAIKDGIGDIFVVLVILFKQNDKFITFDFTPIKRATSIIAYCCISFGFQFDSIAFDYLNDIALSNGHDLTECANLAWNEIKGRKGKLVNGTFIKN